MPNLQLFQAPRLRAHRNSHNEERHATWLELFYDLVFVAAISQLASKLSDEYSIRGWLEFAALFVPVWWAWIGHTFYLTRFDSDDIAHRLLTLLQMVFVASLAVHVPRGLSDQANGFALSYVGVRAILILQYWRAGKYLPAARPLTSRYTRGFSIAALLWILSTIVPAPWKFVLWALAIIIDLVAPLGAGKMHAQIPPHFSHLPERFGLFTIIVLGEAIIATVQGTGKQALQGGSIVAALFGLMIAFALWWNYFENIHAAEARQVATSSDVASYQIWLYAHLPLTMAITAMAIGVKHILNLKAGENLPSGEGFLLGASVGVCLICLNLIYLHSPDIAHEERARRYLRPHLLLIALTFLTAFIASFLSSMLLIFLMTVFCVAQVLLSLRDSSHIEKKR